MKNRAKDNAHMWKKTAQLSINNCEVLQLYNCLKQFYFSKPGKNRRKKGNELINRESSSKEKKCVYIRSLCVIHRKKKKFVSEYLTDN